VDRVEVLRGMMMTSGGLSRSVKGYDGDDSNNSL
jgi:hypothetical protein